MGKENQNIMPNENEKAIEPESFSSPDFNPEEISRDIARSLCEPSERLYKRDPELKKDPFKAMGEVRLAGKNESEIPDPLEGLFVGAAKLETAKKELNLTPKQKEAFNGVLENIHGAIAWAKGATEEAKDYIAANKVVRKTLIGAQVVGLTLTSAGCVNVVKPSEAAFTETPVPAETFTPTPTEALTPTPTETATSTPLATEQPTELAPIPEAITNTLSALTQELNKNNEREEKTFEVVQKDGAWVLTENIAKRETFNSTYNMQTEKYESETLVREARVLDTGVVTPEGFIFNSNGVEQTVGFDMLATDGRATLIIKDEKGEMRYKFSDYKGEWLENKWQLSPDGHVYFNEAELYDGMFTINKDHSEFVEEYWENTIRGLWKLNYVGENYALLNQFPTADSLVEYVKNGGGPVYNLQIPVPYPEGGVRFVGQGALVYTKGPVDLSAIALSIYKPTTEEIYSYSPNYKLNPFLSYRVAKGEVLIEEFQTNGKNVLKFTHRRDMLIDSTVKQVRSGQIITGYAFSDAKNPEENMLAALQSIMGWNYIAQGAERYYDASDPVRADTYGWVTAGLDPPMINFSIIASVNGEPYIALAHSPNPPIAIR